MPQAVDRLTCVICSCKTQCPFNWKRHHSGADTLLLTEQDLMSFYEAGELNLTVDWKCLDVGNGIASHWQVRLIRGIDLVAMRY